MVILFGFLAGLATFLGGLFAIKFKDKLHLILGFSAGAVIGVVFFDLLPESIELASNSYDVFFITSLISFGFLLYLILDRTIYFRYCREGNCHNPVHKGKIGAGTLIIHSFLDGMAIGLAFQGSYLLGLAITLAVLAHDFSDGVNTVSLILGNHGEKKDAIKWLSLDAMAPFLGAISTLFFHIPQETLGLVLAIFCGFFLYIGASELLPESHHDHPKKTTTLMTLLGVLSIYLIIRIS